MARLAAVAAVAFALAAGSTGCSENSATTLLVPSGELPGRGVLTGSLVFDPPGSFPPSLVIVARITKPSFVSANTSIRVTGTNTDPIFNIPISPSLEQLAPGLWADTLTLPAGALEWKFVTNDVFDNPDDYSTPDASRVDGLENTLVKSAPGSANLDAVVPANLARPNEVICLLDETTNPPSYKFRRYGDGIGTISSGIDGSFTISGLAPGTYALRVRGPSNLSKDTTVTIGTAPVVLAALRVVANPGTISGSVIYDPSAFPDLGSPPYPPTTVQLFSGAVLVNSLVTGRASNTFSFSDVTPGTYRVVIDAPVFSPLEVADVVVVGGANTDVGARTLIANNLEVSNFLNVAGDFNGFAIDPAYEMSQNALGVWSYTTATPIPAGDHFMKFVTDQAFDTPPDYGGDETVTITVPVTNAVTRKVTGSGTALKLSFPSTSNYTFTLDERRQTFSVDVAPAPRRQERP